MPFEVDDQQRVDEAIAEAGAEGSTKLLIRGAAESQKLGPVTVISAILNRTIGNSNVILGRERLTTKPYIQDLAFS